jgi:hypothetical protein
MGLKVPLLVVCLLTTAAVPATAQLADPLSLAASGVLLPFFSDPTAGFVSVLEVVSPTVSSCCTNPIHAVFFQENCARNKSVADVETAKQAKAYITSVLPLALTNNGLAAIANTLQGNDLVPLNFPLHTRTHWIDAKTGRLRELEPIILDTFLTLAPGFLPLVENPGAGASIGLCGPGAGVFTGSINNGFCWSPLRSAATFVTPQETASLAASIYLICPTSDIQNSAGGGVFPIAAGFPRLQNRDGTFGFPSRQVVTGNTVTTLRGRIYNDDESGPKDILVPCACLTATKVATIDSLYSTAPVNLGAHTVPVWYTELEAQSANPNPVVAGSAQFFSFTGYWGLEVTGRQTTLFHRMSNASLDNLSFGTFNVFANR